YFSTYPSVPTRYPMGGDTQGLAADATGVFHAAWINGETGVMQLWLTSFRVAPALAADVRSRRAGGPGKPSAGDAAPPGMEDVTHDVRFVVTKTRLDFTERTYAIT